MKLKLNSSKFAKKILSPKMKMSNFHSKAQIYLLTISTFFVLIHGRPTLDPSDLEALTTIQKHLGVESQRQLFIAPCNIPGVFCERRLSDDNTYVLRITRLIFQSRGLTGTLSPAIGRLSELKELSLSGNSIVDQVPPRIADCKKLEVLNLGNNRFSGEVPANLTSLVRLRVLDVSANKFSGDLSFLKYFPNLEKLSVANNRFAGKIPVSIRSFRNLRSFDYSGNQFLEGSFPQLKSVEDSGSSLPKRYRLAENSNSTRGNSTRASPTSSSPAQSPTQSPHKGKTNKKKKIIGWVLGFFAGAIAGCISGFIFSLLFKLVLAAVKGGGKEPGPSIFSPLIKKKEDLAFLQKEDGLASLELIGKGGCGEVYKAEFPGIEGKWIAIKKVIQPPREADELTDEDSKLLHKKMRQVKAEINTVGRIRHRNLLPLLAHISRPDCHLLVYEYMKNGSLQDRLMKVNTGEAELHWLARHNVAIGVAAGLEYLHVSHTPHIVHRDLKPGNVLLDDNLEARIADFGLAKAIPEANTHATSSNVAGTVGFIAPEYHQTLKFTDKCDIYSFGVLLGVLVMGKLPSDDFFQHQDEIGLVKWMRSVMTSDNPRRAIDPKLMGNGYEEQMLLVLKIACFCTLENPKERPNSKDVRCMLTQINH